MGKILDAFADNTLLTVGIERSHIPDRRKLGEKNQQLHKQLVEKLDEEQKIILEKLLDVISDENYFETKHNFIRGYCLGVLMTMEVFSKQNSFS